MDWMTLFPIFCGFALVAIYALLSSTWLMMKTEGELQQSMFAFTNKVLLAIDGYYSDAYDSFASI
nr:cytochrome d ubiquinol oxidase subunit II [Vibrio rhizosphaerae]